jgi:hypothetical protein
MEPPLFIQRNGRVFITPEGQKIALDALHKIIQATVVVSRATVSRAKADLSRGFTPGYGQPTEAQRGEVRRILPYGYVRLNKEERAMSTCFVRDKFGITQTTALKAKRHGWFETPTDQSKLTPTARDRIRGIGQPLPAEFKESD